MPPPLSKSLGLKDGLFREQGGENISIKMDLRLKF